MGVARSLRYHFRKSEGLSTKKCIGAWWTIWWRKLTFACDNQCSVFINGTKIGENTDFNNPTGKEVKEYLKRGNNVIAVVAANAEAEGPAGFIARLDLELDTQSPRIVTDESWVGALKEVPGWKTALKAPEEYKSVTKIAQLGGGAGLVSPKKYSIRRTPERGRGHAHRRVSCRQGF